MPKYGVGFAASAFVGQHAEVAHIVERWVSARRAVKSTPRGEYVMLRDDGRTFWVPAIPRDPLCFLARCALFPAGISSGKKSIANLWLRSTDERPGEYFASIFSDYPDEAGLFWTWLRHLQHLKKETRLHKARMAVRAARIEAITEGAAITASEIAAYLEQQHGGNGWSSVVEDAVQAERGHVSGKKRVENPGKVIQTKREK